LRDTLNGVEMTVAVGSYLKIRADPVDQVDRTGKDGHLRHEIDFDLQLGGFFGEDKPGQPVSFAGPAASSRNNLMA